MDEEEIDAWYEDEKQKCVEELMRDVEKTKNHDEAEKRYEARMSKVMAKYNKLMNDFIAKSSRVKK